jgi:hypothetical protein
MSLKKYHANGSSSRNRADTPHLPLRTQDLYRRNPHATMLFSAWSLIAPAIFAVVCMSKTKLHAAAFILGVILWHSIFPPSGSSEKRKDLPSKKTYLANLQVETADPTKTEEGHAAKEDCPTCWDEIHDPIRLVCGHRFCKDCILPWLTGTSAADSCPICKRVLFINTPSTQESINQLAHRLRVCAAIVHLATELGKILPCYWILHGWSTSFMPLFRCTTGGLSLWDCFEEVVYVVLSVLMVTTARRSFWTHGNHWHQAHLGGWVNVVATVGYIKHCSSELDTLSAISGLAMRRKF